ncbi:hypothetical protein IFM89_014700 [Coptis chinensis]|uniref:LOB domain-containing protein n=1 Tax=Coptis chinensis TaxID=261450 RepID=A0A835HBR9_9MAGN|nr:hypothetical protein IFM89_014700 [Coptis chinensis]
MRRRCAPECISVHISLPMSLKGVECDIREAPERQTTDAANSLVYEAYLRLEYPVYGGKGAVSLATTKSKQWKPNFLQ